MSNSQRLDRLPDTNHQRGTDMRMLSMGIVTLEPPSRRCPVSSYHRQNIHTVVKVCSKKSRCVRMYVSVFIWSSCSFMRKISYSNYAASGNNAKPMRMYAL